MNTSYIVGIVFRLINFGMLLWIGNWIFNRYILPVLRDQLHARTTAIDQLHAAHHILIKDIRDVERALIDDRHEQDRLKERVNQWRARIDTERALHDEQCAARRVVTQQRLLRQMKQIQMTRLFTAALPSALELARAQLLTKFSNSSAQETYVQRVTTRLKGI